MTTPPENQPTTLADRLRARRGQAPRQEAHTKSPDDELYRDKPKLELLPDSQRQATQVARHELGITRRSEAIAAQVSAPRMGLGGSRRSRPAIDPDMDIE